MEILLLICLWFSIGFVESQLIESLNATRMLSADQTIQFSDTLECESNHNFYLAAVTCNCPTRACEVSGVSSTSDDVSTPCWESSTCTVGFNASAGNCRDVQATVFYVCAPVTPSLVINRETTASGSLLTAGYSTPSPTASGDSASWVCLVQASDCSEVNVTLQLVIRNGNDTASLFSVPGGLNSVGMMGVAAGEWIFPSPFNVFLNVPLGSALLNAYFAVQADTPMTVTCGRRPSPQPTTLNSVSILSTPPSNISGHELTAVHSSSGEETAGDWVCVVETADCSNGTPVQVAFYVSNRPCGNASYFSWNGSQVDSGSTVTVTTPLAVTLHLADGSQVVFAYLSVAATVNLDLACGRLAGSPPQPVQNQCDYCQSSPCQRVATCVQIPGGFQCLCPAGFSSSSDGLSCVDINECHVEPSSCDVTAHCNNTVGSFHCYCDPGYNLTDNGTRCTDINECTTVSSPCDATAQCRNTAGSYQCYCEPGYNFTREGKCLDVNECDVDPSTCDVTANCTNTEGSFHCYCDPGLSLTDNGRGCQVPPITASQSQTSVLGPAVGGAVGGVAVIAVVVVVVVVVLRSRNRKTVSESESSLELDHAVYVNNAYEDPSQSGDNHIMVNYETPLTHPEDQLYTNTGTPASAVTSEDTQDYDVLGQTRPAAAAKSDVIYSHIQHNGFQPDDVEYSYDRAGEKPRRKVITGANYETATFKSPEDEGKEDDAQDDYNSTAKTASPGVITDAVYHALQPVSSAGEPVQDSANNSESQATPAPKQPGAVAVDLEDGPIYTNSEVDEGGKDQPK